MSIDKVIQSAFALIAAPKEDELTFPGKSGIRYIAAANGLFREVNLPWIRAFHRVAQMTEPFVLPYGQMSDKFDLFCAPVPKALIKRFAEDSRMHAPDEIASALVWNQMTQEWRYARRKSLQASPGHVIYEEVFLEDGEHIVVDMHSHGNFKAFFSERDNQDDHGSMKFSLVLGDVQTDLPSSAFRLCLCGLFLRAFMDADGNLSVQSTEASK